MTTSASDTFQGDACGLVDEFRAGRRHPVEEMQASIAAAEANKKTGLNAFSHIDPDRALDAASRADVNLPFGGVPLAVKELESVADWPDTEACVAFANRRGTHTSLQVERLTHEGGMVPYAMTTASEFGGVNVTRTLLNGSTHNPWQIGRTPGGSSGGSAAAVAGGLCTIATAGDGGGSIRIPAGFCGLVGLKATYGRIPRAPMHYLGNLTVSTGCVSRSIRDTARWFDVANGHDARDPLSLPRVSGWEDELGSIDLRGLRVAVVSDWGGATVSPAMWTVLEDAADWVIRTTGMRRVDIDTTLPSMGAAWSISGMISIREELGDLWPGCADDLTPEIRMGLQYTEGLYGSAARHKIERRRAALNERMAEIFRNVDIVMTASNPDVAFNADGPLPDTFGGIVAGANNNGRLTFPANLHGNPALSVPAGFVDGLPVGLQVVGKHFQEQVLLDVGLAMERGRPWPSVAPVAR
ncbi:MAG: amidase [Acidobacteria bacterium]|nr:amidase [Acidobacteriota bacterium]